MILLSNDHDDVLYDHRDHASSILSSEPIWQPVTRRGVNREKAANKEIAT